jgi:hypothetical protein
MNCKHIWKYSNVSGHMHCSHCCTVLFITCEFSIDIVSFLVSVIKVYDTEEALVRVQYILYDYIYVG